MRTPSCKRKEFSLDSRGRLVQSFRRGGLWETVILRAHFDGKQILLDEPFELVPNTELMVTILPKSLGDEREDWARLALENLARAYGNLSDINVYYRN